ncbi:MAG TPA: hypothetical protein VGQ69_02770 [Gemmatimonadales bacterium]|jgi:tetratricopeptide (TPR) repeat protein|nr:hypothetical protein [Gemmatimonadales bacterium]
MRRTSVLVLVTALAAGPLAAQQGGINLRLAQGQPAKYVPPLCPLKANNSKVDKAVSALRKAYDAKTPADRSAQLNEAKLGLTSAITQDAQGNNGAAWYYLARVALLQGDPVGVDSAFTKALALAPSCEIDITQYRQNNWALLGQAGVEMQRNGQLDSAMVQFRDATILFRGLPHVYTNMGVMFANLKPPQEDSAAAYFLKALEIAEADTSLVEDRNAVAQNLAIVYQRLGKNTEAIAMWRKYLGWKPDDAEAQKSLAAAFRAAGMADSADALETGIVNRYAKMNLDSLDTQDLMSVGILAFNKSNFSDAEVAFAKAVKRNPWSRDARYNLANAYFAMARQAGDSAEALRKLAKAKPTDAQKAAIADTVKLDAQANAANTSLVAEATKLLEFEPYNEDNLKLLAQGQRALKLNEAVYKTAETLVALPFSVEITLFQMGPDGAKLAAEATGRAPTDATGKPIKTGPVTLVVEFIDLTGKVIDTKEAPIPVLEAGKQHSISLDAKGAGITGWRYRLK